MPSKPCLDARLFLGFSSGKPQSVAVVYLEIWQFTHFIDVERRNRLSQANHKQQSYLCIIGRAVEPMCIKG